MMIEVTGLTRRFGSTLALTDVSFAVAAGEVVGFLGPNGAGKSTTMKILTCSLAPTRGHARVAGHDVLEAPEAVRRKIGFMPEQVVLYNDQSVEDLLGFVADIKGVPHAGLAEHLDHIIRRTGLHNVRRKLVGTLSHGYRKRAGLAQALVGDPPVLVLDEPTSGLDPHQIVEIRELIKGFQGQRTVLLSSHILSEVSAVCQRVLILDRGRLVGDENADSLHERAGSLADAPQEAARTVVLSWDGDREAVARALSKVTGVDDLRLTDTGAEVVIGGNPVEIRPKLVESVLAAGGRLQNIQDKSPSLEDLFLRLTGGDRENGIPEKDPPPQTPRPDGSPAGGDAP